MASEATVQRWLPFLFRGEDFAFLARNPDRLDTIQKEIVARGTFYELDELLLIKRLLKPNARIVDAGANIGNHAVFFDRVCRAREVIVFEPNPETAEELLANIEKNCCTHVNTKNLGVALSDAPGRAQLTWSKSDENWNNRAGIRLQMDAQGAVEMASLDSVVSGKIDLLKIDVEGMALQVLRGAMRIIAESRPILFVEIDQKDNEEFLSWLDEVGYEPRSVMTMYQGITNFLCSPVHQRQSQRDNALSRMLGLGGLFGSPALVESAQFPFAKQLSRSNDVALTAAIEAHQDDGISILSDALADVHARPTEVRYAQTPQEELAIISLLPAIHALYAERPRDKTLSVFDVAPRWGAGAQLLARLHHRWSYARPIIEVVAVDPDPAHVRVGRLIAPDVRYLQSELSAVPSESCDLVIGCNLLQRLDDPLSGLLQLSKIAREFVLVNAPFEEAPLMQGHVSKIDKALAGQAGAAAIRIYDDVTWGNRGRYISFLLAAKPLASPVAQRLRQIGFEVLSLN